MPTNFILKTTIVFIVVALISGLPLIKFRRRKREEEAVQGDYNLPPTEESHNPFSAGTNPIPFSPTGANGLPTFPYVHQFSQGIDVDPGDIFYLKGHLNIPVEGWGDMKGHLSGGPSHIWENYGHLLSPVDPLKLPAADTLPSVPGAGESGVQRDAEGGSAREGSAGTVPVATLPTGWTPVKCRPPFCNPYVHSFDSGLQVEPGNDAWVDGGLDLPIKSKEGNHFPLDGSLYAGTMPLQVLYGHVITPIDPRKAENKAAASNSHALLDFKRLISGNHPESGGGELPPNPPQFRSSPSDSTKEGTDSLVSPPPIPNERLGFPDIFVTPPPLPDTTNIAKEKQPFRPFQVPNSANLGSDTIANDYVPFFSFVKRAFVLPPPFN